MISSPGNPAIKTLRKLTHRKYRRRMNQFLVDDADVFREAIQAGHRPVQVFSCATLPFLEEFYPIDVKESLLAPISDMPSFSGFIAIFASPEPSENQEDRQLLVLDGVQDPSNMGAILRSAAQFGVTAAWLTEDCADPFSLRALRAGKGGTFHVRIHRLGKNELIQDLPQGDWTIYAADTRGGVPLPSVTPSRPFVLVLGSEGAGISEEYRERSDVRVTIPGSDAIESLNVAVAAGIILYHLTQGQVEGSGTD